MGKEEKRRWRMEKEDGEVVFLVCYRFLEDKSL
jgi:hypothetical protein